MTTSMTLHYLPVVIDLSQVHRSDSIQGIDYIATQIQGFLGQQLKI